METSLLSVSCHMDQSSYSYCINICWSSPCLKIFCWGTVYVHLIATSGFNTMFAFSFTWVILPILCSRLWKWNTKIKERGLLKSISIAKSKIGRLHYYFYFFFLVRSSFYSVLTRKPCDNLSWSPLFSKVYVILHLHEIISPVTMRYVIMEMK